MPAEPAPATDTLEVPAAFKTLVSKFSALTDAHEQIPQTVDTVGRLDRRICQLIKIGISVGLATSTVSTRVPVYILAGGRSSRFGSDKARAELNGTAMILRLAAMLRPVASSITVVAERREKYADLGLFTIADERPGLGPVGGLIAALRHRRAIDEAKEMPAVTFPPSPMSTRSDWLLLCACDWAEARPAWVEQLWLAVDEHADAVVFHDGRRQPLFALYHTRIIACVEAHLREPDARMSDLLERLAVRAITPPPDWSMVYQINTQSDRERYLKSGAG